MASVNPQFDALQAAARARFATLGLPTRRMEDWHYTDLARLLPPADIPEKPGRMDAPAYFKTAQPARLVFIDGILDRAQSDMAELARLDGIDITPLAEGSAFLQFPKEEQDNALLAANLGYLQDGVIISVSKPITRPVELVWAGSDAAHANYGRICLNLAEQASLCLIETHCGAGVAHLVNDISIGAGAKLTHIKLHEGAPMHDMPVAHAALVMTRMELAQDASLHDFTLCLSAALGRHENCLRFTGQGATADMAAVILGSGQQHTDITTTCDHEMPATQSQTTVRAVLTDKARGVFQGKVIVRPDAQLVDAEQHTATLMLSKEAEMNAKPALEIFADDVACAHGSTIGEIDQEAVFFLRSRGLSENAARNLLVQGFIDEALLHVNDTHLRATLQERVAQQLATHFMGLDSKFETDRGDAS